MSKLQPLLLVLVFITGLACSEQEAEVDRRGEANVVLATDSGEIYIKLYDATPLHKENFLKLANEGFFDGMSFHRIINKFMIQTGDPRTKEGADPSSGVDDAGYNIPAEIVDTLLHTEGKVAAARYPDEENPMWESSSSQFYIVTGKFASSEELDNAELAYNYAREVKLRKEYNDKFESGAYKDSYNNFLADMDYREFYYSDAQRATYDKLRGAPGLDFQYTIFGEVVHGMKVVKKIEKLPTTGDRPNSICRIQSAKVLKE